MTIKHTLPPDDLDLKKALHEERHLLENVEVPIITVSATFRKELAEKYRSVVHTPSDVAYSRGHYSMAEAVRQQALLMNKSVHLSDPTNFVSKKDWKKIEFTESIGLLVARYKLLKYIRDKVDKVMRGKLPIKDAITPPLLYLAGRTNCPIVSMHYEAGNILAKNGKTIVQAVTDPHVHYQYLDMLPEKGAGMDNSNRADITFAVFDDDTKEKFYQLADELNKVLDEDQVVVTGPFVDPRITAIGETEKNIKEDQPVNIAITTGGLGTNLNEIKSVLEQLSPLLDPPEKIRLFLYAATHKDFRNYFEEYAERNHVRVGNLDDEDARIRILYEDSIVDGNENIIKYMFPWAHGVITKPSGDMAYDAAVAGCFLMFLSPWGSWEENVQKVFEDKGIGYDLDINNTKDQFEDLSKSGKFNNSLKAAHDLPELYRQGCKNLIELHAIKPCIVHKND
jgi:hypothetical protein